MRTEISMMMGIESEERNYDVDGNRVRNEIIKVMGIESKEQNYKGDGNKE
jgi:hypothetical protein